MSLGSARSARQPGLGQEGLATETDELRQVQDQEGQRPHGIITPTRIFHSNIVRDQFLDEIRQCNDARLSEVQELHTMVVNLT